MEGFQLVATGLLLLLLAGCGNGGGLPLPRGGYPPLLPGQRMICTETVVQMGLPLGEQFSVIGFLHRTVECKLLFEGRLP